MRKLTKIYLTLVFVLLGLITEFIVYIFFTAQASRIFSLHDSESALEIYTLTLAPLVLIPVISYVIKRWKRFSNLYYFAFLITFALAALADSDCIGSGKGMGCDAGSPSMAFIYFYLLFIFLPVSLLYFLMLGLKKLPSGTQ